MNGHLLFQSPEIVATGTLVYLRSDHKEIRLQTDRGLWGMFARDGFNLGNVAIHDCIKVVRWKPTAYSLEKQKDPPVESAA